MVVLTRSAHVLCVALACAACDPLHEHASQEVARCPRACPNHCASCLPAGYCATQTFTAADLGLQPIAQGGLWTLDIDGFPAGGLISYRFDWGFDIAARDGQVPFAPTIMVNVEADVAFSSRASRDAFPIWGEYQSSYPVLTNGDLHMRIFLGSCNASGPSTCFIAPTSTFAFTLADTAPYLEAPPCE